MKSYRKLLSKTMLIYAINFVLGVLVGWLAKPKRKRIDEWDWEYWLKTHPPAYDSSDSIDWDELIWVSPKWKKDGCVNEGVEILGMLDRVLTNDEIKRVNSAGVDAIRASFEDTQEIKL